MSFTVPVIQSANIVQTQLPAAITVIQNGVNTALAYNTDDLFSATPLASLATNIFEGPISLDPRFLGVHSKVENATLFQGGWNRTHDMGPGGSNGTSTNAFRWAQHNPSNNAFFDCGLGAWLDACRLAKQETVYTIFQTPRWISARSGLGNNPAGGANEGNDAYGEPGGCAEPTDMTKLGAFITWLMTNYGSRIDYLEVWNEPKYIYDGGTSSYFSGTPAKLAEIARTIYLAAKAIKPSIKILGPACTGINNNAGGGGIDNTNQFLVASDNNAGTGKLWIDILSVHTYEHSGTNKLSNLLVAKGYLDTIKAANGISAMPVWSTEFGYITPAFTLYTGPSLARANMLLRFALYNIAIGMTRASLYPFLNTDPFTDPLVVAEWNRYRTLLGGAVIQRINRIGNGDQLACIINGQNYIV